MATHFNLADLFETVVDTVPAREALVCGDSRLSFAELDAGANQLAHYLAGQGVKAGDHVGLYMYNGNEYLEAMLACFKIRAVPINVNYRYVKAELLYIFDNADMVACIHHREFIPAIADVREDAKTLKTLVSVDDHSGAALAMTGSVNYKAAKAGQRSDRNFSERSGDDYFVIYTGGTTGMPKGVMWPHEGIFFAAMGGGGHFSPLGPCEKPEDIASRITEWPMRGIALAPLIHGASWWYACIQLLAGNALILNPNRSFDGAAVWQIVADEKVNALQIVGDAMAIPLLEALAENPDRWDLSAVFSIGSGGAIFSDVKQAAFKAYFPNVFLTNSFGSSESGQMGMDNGSKKTAAGLGNVSRSDYMDVIIVEESAPRRAELGETGIFARIGYTSAGYYKDPVKTAETFVELDGKRYLLTGDAAKLEADGSITVLGRGSNCINSGGEKIFPEEVEGALKAHAGVYDALVVGLGDERFGSRVSAVIQPRHGINLDLSTIQEHCRKHIAGYKIPREIHLIQELPRAPSGKPDYNLARAYAESGKGAVG
ncbi:MAG: acyl-CoA synthetase [Zhongshania sp.]|uniref:acyl-CoA synthetase n=1 Tax=Zhongshania sp. TaxID=1971902 RepID=UPI0026393310|nr:acyl-CoA synthetase [Zhongshania sp.]MDF1692872.1 acyl-CoA synthetase [Zhongshania sp.]